MTIMASDWQTEKLAKAFLEGVRGAIPGADLQLEVIGTIAGQWCKTPARILDLGCGNGILGSYLLQIYPETFGVFADFSDPMLAAARKKLAESPRAEIVKADFGGPGWLEAVQPSAPFDLIVSGFAIHHQPDDRKKALYAEIFEQMSPGGVFLNLEHVASLTPAGEQLFDEFFVDSLYSYHAGIDPDTAREQIVQEYYNRADKKENILAPVDEQCNWLREIGYQDVDCFFKLFEMALFGGRKPTARQLDKD